MEFIVTRYGRVRLTSLDSDVHLSHDGAGDAEVCVNVCLGRTVLEVDLRIVPVILLAQVERELVVYCQVI